MKTKINIVLTAATARLVRFRTVLITLIMAVIFLACASQSPPGGGPVDKEPPEVAASAPENGQTNVDPRAGITVTFSEWIGTAGAANAVSVYPPLARGFEVKAAKNRLTVLPKEPLSDNTTYHVIIGTTLQDLRGNAITAPINVVFSTGAELDSGSLAGVIVPLGPLPAALRVALYRDDGGNGEDDGDGNIKGGNWEDERYFTPPDYAVRADTAGAFSFSNLREGRYRAVAFTDQFRIGRLRVGDPAFTSLEKSVAVTKEKQAIRLYPTDSDTAAPRISEKALADTTPPTLQKQLPSGFTSHLPEVRLVWTKPVRVSLNAIMAAGTEIETKGKGQPESGTKAKAGAKADTTTAAADTATVAVAAGTAADTAGVDTVTATVEADSVEFRFIAADGHSDTTRLIPSRRLLPSKAYRLSIPVEAVTDTNGVAAADSIVVIVRTLAADRICYRLHGGADCLEPNSRRKWVYRPTGMDETFTVADRDGTFSFDTIPSSKGTLMWFIDDNDDNRLTTGKLIPWRAPERFFVLPDTVEAKAKWEVEDLQVRGCE